MPIKEKEKFKIIRYAVVVQLVERLLAKEKVAGSSPVYRSRKVNIIIKGIDTASGCVMVDYTITRPEGVSFPYFLPGW